MFMFNTNINNIIAIKIVIINKHLKIKLPTYIINNYVSPYLYIYYDYLIFVLHNLKFKISLTIALHCNVYSNGIFFGI